MVFVESALTWVDSGAVAYPALHQKIIELTMPALVVKKLFPEFPLVQGRTATFVKQSGSRAAAISQISEGAEIPMDFTPYTEYTVTPYKKGLRERVSRENIEDLYIPVIEDQLRRVARRMAFTIDNDCMTVIDLAAGNAPSNTFAATGLSLGSTGVPFGPFYQTGSSGPVAIGSKDLLAAKALLETYSLIADTILINPVNLRDVMYLPQFSLWAQYGNEGGQGVSPTQTGKVGTIFGMNVYVSMVVPVGKAYVISTGQNLSAAYAPLGFFVIKRPLMTDVEIKKEFDAVDVSLTTRYCPVVTYGEAIVRITNLSTA